MNTESLINTLIERYPALNSCKKDIEKIANMIITCYENEGQLLICGNGGSSSDTDHIVGELMKSFSKKRPVDTNFKNALTKVSDERGAFLANKLEKALPAISLSAHTALTSAVSNDIGGDLIYAQQVNGYGRKGDMLLGITTSGNSQNIIDAAITAKAKGLKVIGLTGKTGGKLKQYCDTVICVPALSTPEIQELHLPVYHTICQIVEHRFF
ncbi:MAG: phosphoheptose isomerase [Bacteroidetes bacterium 4572_77]|nr:MAG: phosphoheptose isomerase [Bacteroidetes bacterium 4572_77]